MDLESGISTFPAGSGEEIWHRIRIWSQKSQNPLFRAQKLRKNTSDNVHLNLFFPICCFLLFGLWVKDLAMFDLKFGFYVKFPPRNRLERSRIRIPGPKMTKLIFESVFLLFSPRPLVFKGYLIGNFLIFWTWIPNSRPFQPVPGRKFHVESDFRDKNKEFQSPGAKH